MEFLLLEYNLKAPPQKYYYFRWPDRTKMQRIYQNILKEGNGNKKCLRFPDIQDNKFDILRSAIVLDKVDQVCEETVRAKPTGNDSGFITYSKNIYISGIWLYNSGYIITQQIFGNK